MKRLMCGFAMILMVGCGEDANGINAAADTDIEQTDASQGDAETDTVEVVSDGEQPVILLDFDLESVPAECVTRKEGPNISDKQVIVSVEQLNSGPIPFLINYSGFVKGFERKGYAIAFEKHPFWRMRIEMPEDSPAKFLETTFLLYEEKGGTLIKIGEQNDKALPDYSWGWSPTFLDFPDEFGIPTVSLLEGNYALEVQTGVGSAFQITGQLRGSFYFVDLDCLD